MPCAESCVRRRNCSPPGTNTSAWRGRSAPPDSTRSRSGRRFSSATSMARSSLRIVVGLVVPPRTVGSFATTRHWVCATSASATTTPPPTGSSVCRPASGLSSSTGVPGSTRASRRSRTIILPRARWRSTYFSPPPARTPSCSRRTSSLSVRMASALARYSVSDVVSSVRRGVLIACSRGGRYSVVSHEGRRFSRNASMPSAASAPPKRSAESCVAAVRPSCHPRVGRLRSRPLVARTAPGAP